MADYSMGLTWRTRAIVLTVAFGLSLSVIALWAAGKTFALVLGDFVARANAVLDAPPPEPKMQNDAMPFQVVPADCK